jgi:two-component system sensor histidine kinase DegS
MTETTESAHSKGESTLDERDLAQRYNELQRADAARSALLKTTIGAQEQERLRVANELHDELAQSLTGLLMSLDAAERLLDEQSDPEPEIGQVRAQLARTGEIAARLLGQVRRLIIDLRPPELDDLGLAPAVRSYAESHLGNTGAVVAYRSEGVERRLSPEAEIAIYRIVQEAINNVARHSGAGSVRLSLLWTEDRITVVCEDDGCGFDTAAAEASRADGSVGLLGMHERAEMIGADLSIETAVNQGTRVDVTWAFDSGGETG